MRDSRNGGWIFFLLFLFLFGGFGTGLLSLIIVVAVIVAIVMIASNSARKNEDRQAYNRGYRRTSNYTRTNNGVSAAAMAKINVYLRKHFKLSGSLSIGKNIELRVHGTSYASLSSLDVYRDNSYICSLDDFARRYPDSYTEIIASLSRLAEQPADVFDAEVSETKPQETKQAQPADTNKGAQYYIETINSLNNDIPDEEISNGLFETTALLKQIQNFEVKIPNSRAKLSKLYEYYLPILIRILKQYETLQDARTDENYVTVRDKLRKTIKLINDAMKTIISSMTDQDMMNLSADLSTLEALLQKDGLTSDGQMKTQTKDGE